MKLAQVLIIAIAMSGCVSAHAAGDAQNGKLLYAKHCGACHSLDANLAGPAHRGLFGRKAGSVAGFDYSPALKNSQVIWNAETLELWLKGPEQFIPGQAMWYSVPDARERDDLVAYLRSESAR